MSNLFALVDCNNFYVSCERAFDPRLANKPVVVLSNNDSCVIARSNEAKALGIKMGSPYFKIKHLITQHNIIVRSSNYALYGDMSSRVMSFLSRASPRSEIYSIDECFLDFSGIANSTIYAKKVRQRVQQNIGLPVCVGIGSTKTLSKFGNCIAKKLLQYEGVFDFSCLSKKEETEILDSFDVQEIWGIGWRLAEKLRALNIRTARALRDSDLDFLQRKFNSLVRNVALELRGFPCLELTEIAQPKKQIMTTRCFGKYLFELNELEQAVTNYMSRAAEKLREEGLFTGWVQVFLEGRSIPDRYPFYPAAVVTVRHHLNDTVNLVKIALSMLKRIYRPGYAYQKAGVILADLYPASAFQLSLFDEASQNKGRKITELLDSVNAHLGKSVLHLACEGTDTSWHLRADFRSPAYTTCWDSLPIAKAN